jgi:hypothetical protein
MYSERFLLKLVQSLNVEDIKALLQSNRQPIFAPYTAVPQYIEKNSL